MALVRKKMSQRNKKFLPHTMAIFFDFDEVLHTSKEEKSNCPNPLDIALLTQITQLAIKHNFPLIIITARADSEINRNIITQLITLLKGFHSDIGGFHPEDIYCLGVESIQRKSAKKSLISIREPKVKVIQKVHAEKFPTLSNEQIFFIDDEEKHVSPVEKAGYSVIRAKAGSKAHLENILEIMQKKIQEMYSTVHCKVNRGAHGLFKVKEGKRQPHLALPFSPLKLS